ncbi:MAG: hypothetical protein IJC71_06340 [Clostridia bacterium]|nr:hypothetical protein [Clostridia bacterium]
MKPVQKLTAILCALSLLLPLAGCVEHQDENPQTNTVTPETTPIEEIEDEDPNALFKTVRDDLPADLKLNGRTVTYLSRGMDKTLKEIHAEEMNGEVVNDAIFQREITVEERLECKIENIAAGVDQHGSELLNLVATSVHANDAAYDILANSNYSTSNQFSTGYFLNLHNVENLNLEKEYWAQHLIDSTEIGGALFGVTGSHSLFMYQEMFAVFFNRNLCEQHGLLAADIYETVFDGKWTLDKMIELTKDIYVDKNGNGVADESDVYGYGLQVSSSTDGYWSSCQIRMTSRNSDGTVALDTDTEKLVSVVERLTDFSYNQKGVIRLVEGDGFTHGVYLPEAFAKDQLLFMNDWIYATETAIMRDMESDYGIIPYPKYDEVQSDYYSYLHDGYTIFCILSTVENSGEIGAVLEAMASDSHNRVIPAYYETALTTKYARDQDSVTSLQTIFQNAYLDTGWVYSLNLNSYPQNVLREPVWRNGVSSATIIARMGKLASRYLDDVMDSFAEVTEDQEG